MAARFLRKVLEKLKKNLGSVLFKLVNVCCVVSPKLLPNSTRLERFDCVPLTLCKLIQKLLDCKHSLTAIQGPVGLHLQPQNIMLCLSNKF